MVEARRDDAHDEGQAGKRAGDALEHREPFVEYIGGAKDSQGKSIRVDGQLSKPRK